MVVITEITAAQLAELVKQIQAGNEVLLTQDNRPIARLVAADDLADSAPRAALQVHSFKGHRALTPVISQQELADEMFSER
jgi:antitoxin (DNA-binding transcriptional repressor) of toxin-antitoxin stability system